MSLLAMLAAKAGSGTPVDVYDPGPDTNPYTFPTSTPYNVDGPAITPTYDYSGEGIHPDVVDFDTQFGMSNWNGYRYWMGMTPYTNAAVGVENPSIVASKDGYTWHVPPGLTNPIAPALGARGYNSDTDLVYDPDTGRLWCFWRELTTSGTTPPPGEHVHAAWSTDGATWNLVYNVAPDSGLSPAVERVGPGDWRMIVVRSTDGQPRTMRVWTASDPAGPWTYVGPASTPGWGGVPWHFGMTLHDGVFYGLIDVSGGSDAVYAAASTDLLTWAVNPTPVVVARPGQWDAMPYRACLTPHENGTHCRVWYSALASDSTGDWRTGYTLVPLSEWPAPPPA